MANFYGKDRDTDFAAAKLMSFGKSFSRMNGQPLDESEVWYDKTALDAFAAGNSAYIGMKLVYVDETHQKVYQYSVQYDGTVKEIGVAPLGDEKSIVVDAETGTVSLKDIDSLVFEREVEGETEEIQYQPLMTKAGLVWVEPSKTTVEGLATLIEALTQRVSGLEGKVGAAAGEGTEASGLYALLDAETARAEAAEKALGERIDGIDFVDETELATALEPYAKTADVNNALADKADKTAYDQTVSDLDALEARVEAFLTGSGTEAALDSLQELIAYIDSHDDVDIAGILKDIQGLENKLTGIDTTVVAYVTAAIDALKIGDYAKAADLTALATRVTTLEGKVDVDKVSEAITAAEGRVDTKLADKANVSDVYTKSQVYNQDEIDELLENIQAGSSESAASVKTQLDSYKKVVNTEVWGNEEGTGDSRIDRLEAVGAQANVIEAVVAATGAKITATKSEKTVTIDDSALVALITAAQAQADKGVTDAATAQAQANSNASDISAIKGRLDTAEGNINTNASGISALDTRLATAEGKVTTLESTVATKAETSTVEALASRVGTAEGTITGHTSDIAAINTALNNKANVADVYTKTEIGTIAEGKTIVQMIADAQTAATYDDTAVRGLINDNTTAIAAIYKAGEGETPASGILVTEIARVEGKVQENTDDIAEINALLNTVDNEDSITSLKELAIWVEEHGSEAAEMAENITANTNAIAAINNETTGILATAKAYTDAQIPTALVAYRVKDVDNTTLQLSETGVASVKAISTDLLVQGTEELILNGGSAV